jgi:hypothetical protein
VQKLLHPLHHPEPPRRKRQTIPADGGVLAGRVHRTPDGAAVALGHAVGKLRNPKRIPRRSKASQHVAVLVARLGGGKCRQGEDRHARVHDGRDGEFCPGVGIAVASVEHHAALSNAIGGAAQQPP